MKSSPFTALDEDLTSFPEKDFRVYNPESEQNQTKFDYYEAVNQKVNVPDPVIQATWRAVYTNGKEKYIDELKNAMMDWYPVVFEPHNIAASSTDTTRPSTCPQELLYE